MRLDGEWFNELGSKMILKVKGRNITGTYHTAVGDASGIYELVGRTDTNAGATRNVGFVVSWENDKKGSSNAVTAWSGELQMDANGDQVIVTTWLLTEETDPIDNWKSTIIGKDVFRRTTPTAASARRARKLRRPSHKPRRK